MPLRTFAIAVALALLGLFVMLNWPLIIAPATLSLAVAEVQAPLGLVMLGLIAAVAGVFVLYILAQQAAIIMESRRMAKELKAQRELADQAEASRFQEMRQFLEAELRRIEAQSAGATRELSARIEGLEQALVAQMGESTRTLSAYIGEVEDKLDRLLPRPEPG